MAALRRVMLGLLLAATLLSPAVFADDSTFVGKPTQGGMGLTLSVAGGAAVTVPTQAGAYFFTLNDTDDTSFGLSTAVNPIIRRVDTIYSDTIGLTADNAGYVSDPAKATTDTTRKVDNGDTGIYILALENLGNVPDSIAIVLDTALTADYTGLDTMGAWSVHVFDSRGVSMGVIRTRGLDTLAIRLAAFRSETFTVKAFGADAAGDTSWLNFRLRTYVGNGNPSQFAVRAYRGFNGDTYGGDGHDSITLYTELKVATGLRVGKSDTAFSAVSLGRGTSPNFKDDTQHYIPGAIVVHTLWFDNDDSRVVDTQIILEEWIDTRYVLFDSAGLTAPSGAVPQTAAAAAFVTAGYGNIFRDSAMPLNTVTENVRIEYQTAKTTNTWNVLTDTTPRASVGRIRWIITRSGGSGVLLSAHDTDDDQTNVGAAPLGIGAVTDSDLGYVRYTVVIRSDSQSATRSRPEVGTAVGNNPGVVGLDTAFLEPDTQLAARTNFVDPFTVELLPNVDIVPETFVRQKAHESSGDTFFYAHTLSNHANGPDSIALSGTTVVPGAYITFFIDTVGGAGVFDGAEPRVDSTSAYAMKQFETEPILIAVFVPSSFMGQNSAYITAKSSNKGFSDTAEDIFIVVGETQVLGVADSGMPTIVGQGDTLSFTLNLNVPCTEDTIIITIDSAAGTPFSGGITDSAVVVFDSECNVMLITDSEPQGQTMTYNETTGILIITFDSLPPSDTYLWQIVVLDVEGGVIETTFLDTGTFTIDTVPPFFTDTVPAKLFAIDTTLLSTETAVSIRLLDTAVGDTNSGIDSIVITIRDTAGTIIKIDTVDAKTFYQFPFDTAGFYTVEVIAIDYAGNTTAMNDSLVIQIPVKRSIDAVAKDKNGVVQPDDVARGLNSEGCVTVKDPTANTDPATPQTITVTVTSDADPAGIPFQLVESGPATGVFEGCFKFTNGVSNAAAGKIKVDDGGVITVTYDPDGAGGVAAIRDQISWQGQKVENLDVVRTWPNPFNALSDPEIIFQNLPPDPTMTIDVYNLNAEKLFTLRVGAGITFSPNQNTARWNARNSRGQLVASGVYVYLVRSSAGTKVGKLTIVH